jgi:transcriptional regulator with XRE-family HTH domain
VDARDTVKKRKTTATGSPRDVARRLRRFREAADITQEVVAKRAGVSAKFISEIENGHVNPSIALVARLVEDGLEIPMSAFFSDDKTDELRGDLSHPRPEGALRGMKRTVVAARSSRGQLPAPRPAGERAVIDAKLRRTSGHAPRTYHHDPPHGLLDVFDAVELDHA